MGEIDNNKLRMLRKERKIAFYICFLCVVGIISAVLSIFKIIDSREVIPIQCLLLGIANILHGYSNYCRDKKKEAVRSTIIGILLIILSIFYFASFI